LSRHRARRALTVLHRGTLLSALLAAAWPVSAQTTRGTGEQPVPGRSVMTPSPSAPLQPDAPVSPLVSNPLVLETVPRNFYIDGVIDVRATGTDRGRLDRESGKDILLGVSPRLSLHSRGAQLRVNATVGVDHVDFVKNTDSDYTQPLVNADMQAEIVDNLVFLDGSLSLDRRSTSPFSVQGADVPTEQQVETGILRLVPRVETRNPSGWNLLARSDNIWTKRSSDAVVPTSQTDDSYSQNTFGRLERMPERIGYGIEGGWESLRYQSMNEDVIQLQSGRLSLGMAVTPQFTGWLLAGAERSRFDRTTQTDADYGVRLRWAPLERSVVTAEVRKRFFGTGFNAQWDHRNRDFALSLGGSREPLTAPEAVQLGGNIGEQFDNIYRARGYSQAQREALVRAALVAYGLPANLTDPVSLQVSRPQLATTANGILSLMGRRTVLVLTGYYRRLVELRHSDDPVLASVPGDVRQVGAQLSLNVLLTPLTGLDAFYRIDDSKGLGFDAGRTSRDQVYSIGTTHSLSPKTRVNLSIQHHRLDSNDLVRLNAASANSATLGLTYRF